MSNIYAFRSTKETEVILQRERNLGNLSKFINDSILLRETKKYNPSDLFIPADKNACDYKPLSMLSLVYYSRAIKLLSDNGYQVFSYTISKDLFFSLFMLSKEIADNEFNTYFHLSESGLERTERPLPRIMYSKSTNTLKITYYEDTTCND